VQIFHQSRKFYQGQILKGDFERSADAIIIFFVAKEEVKLVKAFLLPSFSIIAKYLEIRSMQLQVRSFTVLGWLLALGAHNIPVEKAVPDTCAPRPLCQWFREQYYTSIHFHYYYPLLPKKRTN
jgi:hypothetical protein